jgi:hypothetical protein
VNCTLIEININGFFAVYFGLLFMLIAGVIFWRIRAGTHPKPFVLLTFSSMVFVSGLLCFFLQKDWFVRMHWISKVPVYVLLGMSVAFALLFALADLLNYFSSQCCVSANGIAKPIIETETQVYLVVLTSIALGITSGLVFGFLDMEDERVTHLKASLVREHLLTYPVAGALTAGAALINQYLREKNDKGYSFDPLKDDDLDDDDF